MREVAPDTMQTFASLVTPVHTYAGFDGWRGGPRRCERGSEYTHARQPRKIYLYAAVSQCLLSGPIVSERYGCAGVSILPGVGLGYGPFCIRVSRFAPFYFYPAIVSSNVNWQCLLLGEIRIAISGSSKNLCKFRGKFRFIINEWRV